MSDAASHASGSVESSVGYEKQRNSFEECMQRLRLAVGADSDVTLAKALGIKQPSVASARSRKKIPASWILEIAKQYGVSADWILYGDGPMYRAERAATKQDASEKTAHEDEFCYIPKVAAVLNAGHGSWVTDQEILAFYAFRKDWIKTVGNPSKMVLMEVSGDSMTPTIQPGDHVLIDHSQTRPRDGSIMAIGIDDMILIKRITVRPDCISLVSDNRLYDPIILEKDTLDAVRFLGRVVWLGRQLK